MSLLDSVEMASEPDVTASSNPVQNNTDCKFDVMPPLTTFDKTIIALALVNSIAVPASQAATIIVDRTCT